MDPGVTEYIQRQLALGKQRLRRYVVNPRGRSYPKRNIYIKTWGYVERYLSGGYSARRWVIIPGLRGTGKTTILAQTYYELVDTHNDQINILYFSLDEAIETIGAGLNEVLNDYERLLGESFEALTKPTFILIDEVQSDPRWASVLKALNERAAKVFLLCSGSSAIHLQGNADVAGRRAAIERLYPMNFCEYQMVRNGLFPNKGLKGLLNNALYESSDAHECHARLLKLKDRVDRYWAQVDRRQWRHYIYAGSLPFALMERTYADVFDAVLETVDKIISKDIQQLGKFTPDTMPVIKRLLYLLAEGDVISNHKLVTILDVTAITISNILDILVQAELLIRIPPYGSQSSAVRKASKYLFMSSVIRAAFFNIAGSSGTTETREGKLLEDIAGLHYCRNFGSMRRGGLAYDSAAGGADFIVRLEESRIAVEIGRGKKTSRQVAATIKRVKCKYGLVISDSPLAITDDSTTVKVPWDYFALV